MADTMTVSRIDLSSDSAPGTPALVIGDGGGGVFIVTWVKAATMVRRGTIDPAVRFLGLDVKSEPPTVTVKTTAGGTLTIKLLPEIEYLQLGAGCNPPALRAAARRGRIDGRLRDLVERQPGGRLTRSLENGSEGERLFGLLGYEWSRAEARRLISSALTDLNDLRLSADGERGSASSPLVIVASSLAGGVGAAITLPVVADVKREMDRLGMDPGACIFLTVAVLPETFPPSLQRSSNTLDTILDYDHGQTEGLLPW